MNDSKKIYGLIMPQKSNKTKTVLKTSVFADDDDDDDDGNSYKPKPQTKTSTKQLFAKRHVQMSIEKALAEDPKAFDYDEVYDDVQAKKLHQSTTEKANADCKPKFIHSLLKAADQRKKEDERRIERAVHREREAEKGLYDDKEAFVTESFRQKMKELKAEEEKEQKKRELEELNDVTKTKDFSGFYRNLLNEKTGRRDENEKLSSTDSKSANGKKYESDNTSRESSDRQISSSTVKKEEAKKQRNQTHAYETDSDSDEDRDRPQKRFRKSEEGRSAVVETLHHTGDTDISMSESSSSSEDEGATDVIDSKAVLETETVLPPKDSDSKKSIFDKKTTGDAFMDARARYLARKSAIAVAVTSDD